MSDQNIAELAYRIGQLEKQMTTLTRLVGTMRLIVQEKEPKGTPNALWIDTAHWNQIRVWDGEKWA